jgi:hypothetical protein
MRKKGAAHFEMIIAFVFFVGFVFFIFSIIKPYDEQRLSYAVVEGIFDSLMEEAKTNFTKVFLAANYNSSCFYINLSRELFEYELSNGRVFNTTWDELDSNFINNELHFSKNQSYFYVHFSPDFTEESFNCYPNITNYTLGGIEEKEILSLNKLEKLEEEYYLDYSSVKYKLGVPPIYDFSIIIDSLGIRMEGSVPQTGDIIARENLLEVLNSTSGKIVNSRVNIKVW